MFKNKYFGTLFIQTIDIKFIVIFINYWGVNNEKGNINSVSVVSDGSYLLDGGPFFGPVPKVLWENRQSQIEKTEY